MHHNARWRAGAKTHVGERVIAHDGRDNLSQKALIEFSEWFLSTGLDQITFMTGLFDTATLDRRLERLVERSQTLKPEAARLLSEAHVRGEFERVAASRFTGLPERSARRVLNQVISAGLLASATPKGPVSLRFPDNVLEILFPRLFGEP